MVTGLSGSGKSSLAFDTLYAEGQRRYVESLSAYARQFLATMDKPDVDSIEGLSPAIAIEQKAGSHNPRSTVGTVTEIYDYLRLLYARAGMPRCPDHGIELTAQTVSQMVDQVLQAPRGHGRGPARPGRRAHARASIASSSRISRPRGSCACASTGAFASSMRCPELDGRRPHTIEAVVDRVRIRAGAAQRLAESFETALRLSGGIARLVLLDEPERESEPRQQDAQVELTFSSRHACPVCGYSVPPLEPKLFSFNNPAGACPACDGLGVQEFFDPQRVVLHPQLSLAGGAVRGWDRRNEHYFQLIQSLSTTLRLRHRDALDGAARQQVQQVLLERQRYRGASSSATARAAAARASVIRSRASCPTSTRRYRETESPTVREELARYLEHQAMPGVPGHAPEPRGALRASSPSAVCPEVAHLTVGRALEFFAGLSLPGWRGEVAAARCVKGMVQRLRFLSTSGSST